MNIRNLWLTFIVIFLCVSMAQPVDASKTDSLVTVLKNHTSNDTVKVRILLEIARAYYEKEPSKITAYAEQAEKLSLKLGFKKGLAASYGFFGIAFYRAEQYRKAYENYLKAIPIYLELGDTARLCMTYGNIRLIFEEFKDFDKELEYSIKIDDLAKKSNNLDLKIDAFLNLAFTYSSQKKFEIALKYFDRALYLVNKTKDISKQFDIISYYGSTLKELKQYSKALPYLMDALKFYESKDIYYFDQAYCNNEIGLVYCGLGNADMAEKYLNKSKNLADRLNFNEIVSQNYLGYSKIDSLKHDYKNALKNYQTYILLDREYDNQQQKKQLIDIKIWYETEKSQKEKALLVKEEQRQKALIQRQLIIIFSLSFLLIFIVIAIFINLRQHKKTQSINLLLEKQKLEILEKNKDMEYLHKVKDKLFSVISHDLRSPVIGIQNMLTLIDDYNLSPDKVKGFVNSIREDVNDTSELLNNLLQWSRIQMKGIVPDKTQTDVSVLIDEIIRQLDPIASAKEVELKSEFSIQVQLFCDAEMLKIVLRNLVTNALKYSFSDNPVIIGGYLMDNFVVISVKDSGTGILPEHRNKIFSLTENVGEKGTMLEASTGLGLILCHDFVEKNGGKIWFETEQDKGSTFYFSLPL